MEVNMACIWCITPKYHLSVFDNFKCPEKVNSILFSQLCIYFYIDVYKIQILRIGAERKTYMEEPANLSKKNSQISTDQKVFLGQVTMGNKKTTNLCAKEFHDDYLG